MVIERGQRRGQALESRVPQQVHVAPQQALGRLGGLLHKGIARVGEPDDPPARVLRIHVETDIPQAAQLIHDGADRLPADIVLPGDIRNAHPALAQVEQHLLVDRAYRGVAPGAHQGVEFRPGVVGQLDQLVDQRAGHPLATGGGSRGNHRRINLLHGVGELRELALPDGGAEFKVEFPDYRDPVADEIPATSIQGQQARTPVGGVGQAFQVTGLLDPPDQLQAILLLHGQLRREIRQAQAAPGQDRHEGPEAQPEIAITPCGQPLHHVRLVAARELQEMQEEQALSGFHGVNRLQAGGKNLL